MDYQVFAIVAGVLPLLAFVVAEQKYGLKGALWAALILALIELGFSLYLSNDVDSITIISFAMVAILALVTYKRNNPLWFKMQPTLLGASMALFLAGSYLLGQPMILQMVIKYPQFIPPQHRYLLEDPVWRQLMANYTLTLSLTMGALSGLLAYAALKWSSWWWLSIRIVGLFGSMFLALVLARMML